MVAVQRARDRGARVELAPALPVRGAGRGRRGERRDQRAAALDGWAAGAENGGILGWVWG